MSAPPGWQLPSQGKQTTRGPAGANTAAPAAGAGLRAGSSGSGSGGGGAGGGGPPAPGSLASLYPQVGPDAGATRAGNMAGFASAARRAQIGVGGSGGGGGGGVGGAGSVGPHPAIPPTVTYPASALVTGGGGGGGSGAAASHAHAHTHLTAPMATAGNPRGGSGASGRSSLSSTPTAGGALFHTPSAATSATYRSSLLHATGGPVQLPSPNQNAARFNATPHAAFAGGAGSAAASGGVAGGAGGAVAVHPGHSQGGWGGGGLTVPSSFAGTPSLLPGASSSLKHHAAFFSSGGTAGGAGNSAGGGLAQPAGALTTHSGAGALGTGQGGTAKSLFSVHSSASSGLGSPPVPASFVAVGGVGHALQLQAQQARLELAQQQKVALDVGQPLNALTCSPDRTHLAVGGKEVKIISYSAGKLFKVEQSTNSKTPTALSDIQWHPMEAFASWLVTAPTNGKILLYNLVSKESLRRAERTLDDHERTVNRIVWHPTQGELLFSGSQDGTVKMFDLRTPSIKSALTFADGHSVRDVQVNPFNSNVFAASYENGSIQIWDVRKGSFYHTINAHQGLILTLDWHPEDKDILASGGVDRAIKVWHIGASTANTLGLSSSTPTHSTSSASSASGSGSGSGSGGSSSSATNQTEPLHTIQTIASVGRVRWRPSPRHPFQIASAASLMDTKIHIWNVHKPFVPLVSLLGHKDVVTGFFFADAAHHQQGSGGLSDASNLASEIISCSKDSTIQKNFLHISHGQHPNYHLTSYPAETMCTSGVAWNVRGSVATVNDAIDRRNTIMQADAVMPGPFSFVAHNPALLSSATVAPSSRGGAGAGGGGAGGGAISNALLANMLVARGGGGGATGQIDSLRNGFIRIFDGSAPPSAPAVVAPNRSARSPRASSPSSDAHGGGGDAATAPAMSEDAAFVHFARNYKFTSMPDCASAALSCQPATPAAPAPQAQTFTSLCLHNSEVARAASHFELCQIWLVLAQLLGPGVRRVEEAPTGPPPLPMDDGPAPKKLDAAAAAMAAATAAVAARGHTVTFVPPQFHNPSTVLHHRAERRNSHAMLLPPSSGSDGLDVLVQQYLQVELVGDEPPAPLSPRAAPANDGQHDSSFSPHHVPNGVFSPSSSGGMSSPPTASLMSSPGLKDSPGVRPPPITLAPSGSGGGGGAAPDPSQAISAQNRSHVLIDCLPTIHKSHCYTLSNPAHAALVACGLAPPSVASAAGSASGPPHAAVPAPAPPSNPYNVGLCPLSQRRFQASLLNSYLESSIERGDVQTCVCVVSLLKEFHAPVLAAMDMAEKERDAAAIAAAAAHHSLHGGSGKAPTVPLGHSMSDRMKQWYWSYIDLLQRHELYSCASEIIQLCGDADLAKINQKSTTISLICPVCKHQSQQVGVGCTSKACTKTRMTNCAVCQLTVHGVYVWCQGCGHGGHMNHLTEWFSQQSFCPTGCLHRCVEFVGMTQAKT